MAFKIAIDAGHGYNTPGKRCPDGTREWSLNSRVATYLQNYLKEYNVETIRLDDTTGKKDIGLLDGRMSKAKSNNVDVCISIHHNAGPTTGYGNYTGVEVLVHNNASTETVKLANTILKYLPGKTGLKSRGLKRSSYFTMVMKQSFPTMIIEGGFMNGTSDSKKIKTVDYQKGYAKAILLALTECYPKDVIKKSDVSSSNANTKPSTSTKPTSTNTKTMKATANLWIRSSAKVLDNNKVTVIVKGDSVTIKDTSNKDWYKVEYKKNGKTYTGYASSGYLK